MSFDAQWLIGRVSALGFARSAAFAIAGAALYFAVPWIAGYYEQRENRNLEGLSQSSWGEPSPITLIGNDGKPFGQIIITYKDILLENEGGEIRVDYRRMWELPDDFRVKVDLSSTEFKLEPSPASYEYEGTYISMGSNETIWLMTPKREGNYSVLMRFDIFPRSVKRMTTLANGKTVDAKNSIVLPVTVYTRYNVPQIVVDVASTIGGAIAFVFTIPAVLLTFLEIRKLRTQIPPNPQKGRGTGGKDAPLTRKSGAPRGRQARGSDSRDAKS